MDEWMDAVNSDLEYACKWASKGQGRTMPELIECAQQAIHKNGQWSMVHEGVGRGGGVSPLGAV